MFSFDDYMKRYRDIPFAPWADKAAEQQAIGDALAVLADALDRCRDQDMRMDEVMAALAFLTQRTSKTWPMRQFAKALDMEQPDGRWQNANAALNGIRCKTSDLI